MSSNELIFDKNNQMIQAERNCINFDGSKRFNVNYKTKMYDDSCFVDVSTKQSLGPGNYTLYSPYSCECMMPETVRNSTDNVAVPLGRNGVDVSACVIDDNSTIRWGATKKYPRCPQQLFERPYRTVPYMGKGIYNCDNDSNLKFAEDTRVKKSCNTLSGISIPHQYTPLLDHLSSNIQRIDHLQTEANDPGWRWGGSNTRELIRSQDYLARCGKAYQNKSTNEWFWQNKSQLLQNQ